MFQSAQTLDGRPLPAQRVYWAAFRNPSQFNAAGLYMLQPYQRGRIPLVFIHGVASDAMTWDDMIRGLSANPAINSRYQIWVYQYPTGLPYLNTAAGLRSELLKTRDLVDPNHSDEAIDQTVLVGHSMGGLIAKLQVSHSDDTLWSAVSSSPMTMPPGTGIPDESLSSILFEPVPFVKRVVYIATPHLGSNWTQHPLGRLGRWLIDIPQQLQGDSATLAGPFGGSKRAPEPPTSLDHLMPGNPVILATSKLRPAEGVELHSIIGTGYPLPDGYVGDGVVAVVSARIPSVRSEYFIKATHSGIIRCPTTVSELSCILTRNRLIRPEPDQG